MLASLTVNSWLDNVIGGDGLVTLREAIVAANTNSVTDLGQTGSGADTIEFDPVVFGTPRTILLANGEMQITEALAINGARRDFLTIDAQHQSRIFHITATTGDYILSGLTLTNGAAVQGGGGAIRSISDGNLIVEQCTVSDSTITGPGASGGGIFALNLTLNLSTVSGNGITEAISGGGGGGVWAYDAIVNSSTISGNTISGNGPGGGLYAVNSTISDSTISGNSSNVFAAGIWASLEMTLRRSTVSGNIGGPAIFALNNATLLQSTVSGNSGLGIVGRSATIRQSTITNNHGIAGVDSGAVGLLRADIGGSIIAGNTVNGTPSDLRTTVDDTLTVNYSLIGAVDGPTFDGNVGNLAGTTANPLDPLLGPLSNNGGVPLTHALLPESPAIDAGDPDFDPADPDGDPMTDDAMPFDQRGIAFPRVAFGRIDIGAFEVQTRPLALIVDTTSDVVNGDYSAGDLSLREAVLLTNVNPGADMITFASVLAGTTITLGGTEIEITDLLTIDATALADNVTIDANQASRIFNISATTGDYTLAGLILNAGMTTDDGLEAGGGAIHSLTTDNLELYRTTVSGSGTAGNNSAGGGIHANRLTLNQSIVSGNSTTGAIALGGGIWADALTIIDSVVAGNSSTGFYSAGGGIRAQHATIIRSTVSGNSIAGSQSRGGGISAQNLTLIQSTVSGNYAGHAGQFAADVGGISTINLTLHESTVSGNSAARYAGILAYGAVTLTQSTITDNHATRLNGGLVQVHLIHSLNMTGTIIAGNTAGGVPSDLAYAGVTPPTVNYSLIGAADGLTFIGNVGNLLGTSANPLDAELGPLTNNGGTTKTHALLPGSPAVDAGDPNFDPDDPDGDPNTEDAIPFDQRGEPFGRVVGGRIDIGAFESQPNPLAGDYNFNGVVDAADITVWRDTMGSTMDLRADGSSAAMPGVPDGMVDQFDYEWWKANFGRVLASGSGAVGTGDGLQATDEKDNAGQASSGTLGSADAVGAMDGGNELWVQRWRGLSALGLNGDGGRAPVRPPAEPGAGGIVQVSTRERDLGLLAWRSSSVPRLRGSSDSGLLEIGLDRTSPTSDGVDTVFEDLGLDGLSLSTR